MHPINTVCYAAGKLEQAENGLAHSGRLGRFSGGPDAKKGGQESSLLKVLPLLRKLRHESEGHLPRRRGQDPASGPGKG